MEIHKFIHLGVDYEEINVGIWHPTDKSDHFKKLVNEGTLAFDSLPSYQDEQILLVQSNAIVRYIAKKHGLAGSNLIEESLIDQYFEGVQDLVRLLRTAYNVYYPLQKEVTNTTIEENMEKTASEKLPKFVAFFERALVGKTFLVGEKLSYVDVALFYALDNFLELFPEFFTQVLDKNPNLRTYHQKIKVREGIQKHLNNEKRFPKQQCE